MTVAEGLVLVCLTCGAITDDEEDFDRHRDTHFYRHNRAPFMEWNLLLGTWI